MKLIMMLLSKNEISSKVKGSNRFLYWYGFQLGKDLINKKYTECFIKNCLYNNWRHFGIKYFLDGIVLSQSDRLGSFQVICI